MRKRNIIGVLLLAVIMVVAALGPVTVSAEEAQTKYCEGCQADIALTEYVAIGGEQTETLTLEAGKHYILSADITGAPESGVLIGGAGCIDLNGFNITAGGSCIAISCSGGTTNIMGQGVVTGTYGAAAYGATLHTESSAVVNLYGGTYRKQGDNAAVYVGAKCNVHLYNGATIDTAGTFATYPTAVLMEQANGQFRMHGGTIIGGTTTGNGGSVRVSNGSFIMDGGTITGGQADRGGNIAVNVSGKLTVNGGTITSGTATATYGGGNIYTNKRAVTINGGLITLGTATGTSYGGGNIGIYRATVNIKGGTISLGSANTEGCTGGGNIYAEGDIAKLNISGGTITEGTTVGSGGNISMKYGEMTISGGTVQDGTTTGSDSLGGGNIYVVDTAVTMTDGTISGGVTAVNGGNILLGGTLQLDGGTITGGQAARGGNITVREGGALTVTGGTITSGTATATYGGGNIYTNKCPVTISGGLITQGIAAGTSYGGGNIGIYKATVNMTGGTVSDGSATNTGCRGGGNVYAEGDNAVFNMTGGTVGGGYIATGNGHSIYARSGSLYFGEAAKVTKKADGTGGSMNVYVHDGSLESAGTFAGGVYVNSGTASLTGGKYYSFYYKDTGSCTITGGIFRVNYSRYVPEDYSWVRIAASDEYIYTVVHKDNMPGAVLVDQNKAEYYTQDPLTQYNAADYTHIKLYGDLDLGDISERTIWIDLNGKHLTVSGSGTLYAFDTANDTYDAAACGSVTNGGTVEIVQDVLAPNGRRYIAITDDVTTMHRLNMAVTTVTLKLSKMGLSYKSAFYCDDVLAAKVRNYGMVVSLNNMPGADFLMEEVDINRYTEAAAPFSSGTITQSVAVINIMRNNNFSSSNAKRGEMPIYAAAYVELEGGITLTSDTKNVGKQKTDTDFTGVAYSLHDVMNALDESFGNYSEDIQDQVDAFYFTWKDHGMDWSFCNIGKSVTADLVLEDGWGYCPVCLQKVEWTPIDQATYGETPYGTATDGAHVYLTEDITYTGAEGNAFIFAPATAGHTACFHLNGHTLTATKSRGVYGGQGIINVMGSGTVAGYTSGSKYGAAVQISTSSATGIVNLYSGIYKHAAGSHSGSYAVAVRNYGGTINVYKDAHIDGSFNGKAMLTGTSAQSNSVITLNDTVVDGDIYLTGSLNYVTKLVVDNSAINGTVDADSKNTMILRGAAKAEILELTESTLITLDNLTDGAAFAVVANGCFTETHPQTESYAKYFKAANSSNKIVMANNSLYCIADYSNALELDENLMGYCYACNANVTWQALTDAAVLTGGQHVYLSESLTFEGSDPFITAPTETGAEACLHLNKQNITATGTAIYSDCGTVNIMGGGTVTGLVTVNNGVMNMYSGTYKKHTASDGGTVVCNGGTLNLYADVQFDAADGCAIFVSTDSAASLNLMGTLVDGSVKLDNTEDQLIVTVDSAVIDNMLQIGTGAQVTLTGRPVIKNMAVADGTSVNLENLLNGTKVAVSAQGAFTAPYDAIRTWADYFTAFDASDWIVVQKDVLSCLKYKTLPAGKKVLVIGNSMTYYGKYVIDRGHVLPLTTRINDQGYLYQVCQTNGVDVTVTNFTFGGHTLKDFYSGVCAADRGHNGHNHLNDLTDRNYDYVIFQEGSEAATNTNIYAECKPLMDLFLAENPNTKFAFLVQNTVHHGDTAWRASIKELEENGVIVIDWGAMVEDIINGTTTVPGATETFHKFSFVVNKSAKDGKHPNILAGYLAAQMTYCALSGESAVGMNYSFWNDAKANSSFKLSSYLKTYYSYDATVPSNTNFEAIFASKTDMLGLQQVIDKYLEEKSYLEY